MPISNFTKDDVRSLTYAEAALSSKKNADELLENDTHKRIFEFVLATRLFTRLFYLNSKVKQIMILNPFA